MPQRRTVSCPECSTQRVTKAGTGTRLACASCGHHFRAPAADAQPDVELEHQGAGPDATAERVGGVTIVRAKKATVTQRARPRAPKPDQPPTPLEEPTPSPLEAPELDDPTPAPPAPKPTPAPPPAPARSTTQRAARGGAAYYRSRTRR